MDATSHESAQRRLLFCGALLFAVGLFTGLWSAVALTGKIWVRIPQLALAAHLNGIFGGLWIIVVGLTLPFLSYADKQIKLLSRLTIVPAWSNWGITSLASWLGVRGLEYTSNTANNIVAFLLQAFVVFPALVGSVYWVWGFRQKKL